MPPFTEKGAPYEYVVARTAQKDLRSIPLQDAQRIRAALEKACAVGKGDVLPLRGGGADYRLRVGEYRAQFDVIEMTRTVKVQTSGKVIERELTLNVVSVVSVSRRTGNTYKKP